MTINALNAKQPGSTIKILGKRKTIARNAPSVARLHPSVYLGLRPTMITSPPCTREGAVAAQKIPPSMLRSESKVRMEWTKNRLKLDPKHFKQWTSECGRYLVRWRDQFGGVAVDPGYHACVVDNGRIELVWRYKIFRTANAAKAACEDHARGLNPAEVFRRRKYEKATKAHKKRKEKSRAKAEAALTVPIKRTRRTRSDKGKKRGTT
jgi:hypothetical protein